MWNVGNSEIGREVNGIDVVQIDDKMDISVEDYPTATWKLEKIFFYTCNIFSI